jgi:membrane protease YdiL (CAAX protease family)
LVSDAQPLPQASAEPAARGRRPPADYPGCPVTVDIALAQGRRLVPPRWGIPDAIIPLLGFVLISVVVAVGGTLLDLPLPWLLLLGITLPWIALAGWPLLTTSFQGNGSVIDLGLRLTWRDLGWGVIGGVAALMAGGTIAIILQAIFGEFTSAAGEVGEQLRDDGPILAVIAFALCVAIGAPIAEEIAFRGMAYNALAKRGLSTAWVIAITTLAFSLFHLEPMRAPILLASGLVLGILRWRTRSLGAPIVAHAVNNLPGAAFLLVG